MSTSGSTKNGKKQSDILVGVALILLSAVFAYIALSQPKVSGSYVVSETQTEMYSPSFSEEESEPQSSGRNTSALGGSAVSEAEQTEYPINLNECTAQELMAVNGIGEARAAAIISYREHIGGYTSVEQIKNISGIGDATFSEVAPYLTV